MNRYRTMPGLGPQKASASTVCQKCLKKGHYSYECKAAVQERPYVPRPSRTQQLLNPKLVPKLTSDSSNNLMNSKGVADQQLAEAEARRRQNPTAEEAIRDRSRSPRGRTRSRSVDSSSSVSTISTNRSRSRSPTPSRNGADRFSGGRPSRNRSQTPPVDSTRKRKHRSVSTSDSRSPTSPRREPGSHHKSRRHRTISPIDRGRPSSMRRGSHRSRSRPHSPSMDKSQITKHRRSLENTDGGFQHESNSHRGDAGDRLPQAEFYFAGKDTRGRRERSLSPYSKRLALTQAMNM